jgi:mannose-6-phosphate isomerase-like protein (cupin superfamily)
VKAGTIEERFPWGVIVWRQSGRLDPGATMTVGTCRIDAGKTNPKHYHPNCDEVMYVISGTCRKTIADREFELGPGDCVRIPKGQLHQAHCTSSAPLECLIVYDTPARQVIFV